MAQSQVPRQPANRPPAATSVVCVASSAGGVTALLELLPALPRDFPWAVVCVQHLLPHHRSHMVDILRRRCGVPVAFVEDGAAVTPGVHMAVPDTHAAIDPPGVLRLADGPVVNNVRPSADVLLCSAAAVYGANAVGIVLSGTGRDGATGMRAIHEHGGTLIVEDPASAAYSGMPSSAVRACAPDHVLPLARIAPFLVTLAAQPASA